jgi:hypothetical protein
MQLFEGRNLKGPRRRVKPAFPANDWKHTTMRARGACEDAMVSGQGRGWIVNGIKGSDLHGQAAGGTAARDGFLSPMTLAACNRAPPSALGFS